MCTISPTNTDLAIRFNQIITKGRKDNTYKFALARFLLEHCNELDSEYVQNKIKHNEVEIVDYQQIANKFLAYYWHQECKYRIRQNYNDQKPPHVISIIRDVFGTNYVPTQFKDLPKAQIQKAQAEIRKKVFGKEKSKTSQVVPRFQNIKEGISTKRMHLFYDYDDERAQLQIKPEALSFFHENYAVLLKLVILEWAKFLERVNTLPRLIAKIESAEVKRHALQRYVKIFKDFRCCFYCNTSLDSSETHVDHFIPWSYIFEDESWNLVLACSKCNLRKHDSLAGSDFLAELIRRNETYQNKIKELEKSLLKLDSGKGWEKEIVHHYNNCKLYGFSEVRLP
ncbi:MAG: HNH endonuclease signature motif containing protein [Candidatus Nitrosotenuis sp.]